MAKHGLFSISQNKQDLDRIARILNILVKFQLDQFADKLRLGEKLPIRTLRKGKCPEYKSQQERLRLMIEELGTTFVKFGQMLSTRQDIVGMEYVVELAKLQDNMRPFSTEQAKRIIKEELGKPVSELFSSFGEEPLASASVAQVHRATLKNGKKVVVKIQRPDIEETIKEDVRIMQYLAHIAYKHIPEVRKYDPEYLVDEFKRSIMKELDFQREAKNAQRLKENLKNDAGVYVPLIYEEFCTKRVLTMEEITGTKLSTVINSNSGKYDKRLIARRCMQLFFKMVMVDGFYHADPHPGNIIIKGNNTICFLDFGRVGTVDKEVADNIFRLASFAVNDDVNGLVAHLIRTNIINESVNMENFKADISDVLDTYYSTQIKDVKMGHLLSDLLEVVGNYDFNRPREVAELTRALLILEGVGMQLDPKFNVAEAFEPYTKLVLSSEWNPKRMAEIVKNDVLDIQYLAKDLPMILRRFFRKMEDGRIKLELEHKNLEVFSADLDRISSRLSTALILAALIVASSIIVQVNGILGVLGFVLSGALGIWHVLKTMM